MYDRHYLCCRVSRREQTEGIPLKHDGAADVTATERSVSPRGDETVACDRPTSDVTNESSEPAYDSLRQ